MNPDLQHALIDTQPPFPVDRLGFFDLFARVATTELGQDSPQDAELALSRLLDHDLTCHMDSANTSLGNIDPIASGLELLDLDHGFLTAERGDRQSILGFHYLSVRLQELTLRRGVLTHDESTQLVLGAFLIWIHADVCAKPTPAEASVDVPALIAAQTSVENGILSTVVTSLPVLPLAA